MNVYTCVDHGYMWPVGVCSIVVATSEDEARTLLFNELKKQSLHETPFTLQKVDLSVPSATVLLNGNY